MFFEKIGYNVGIALTTISMKKIYSCYKCGGSISGRRQHSLCLECYNKNRPKGENHPRWTGSAICSKCGGKKTHGNHAKFCRGCSEHKGEKHWNFGRHLSDEVKMKISLSNTGKRMGEDNHKYNSNKMIRRTYRFPYQKWRKEILKMDDNSCLMCGFGPTNIVHHIDPYRDSPDNLNLDNGITLCGDCHKKTFGKEYKFITIFKESIKKRMNSGEVQNG